MSGVDFDRLRTEITMEQVLNLLDFQPSTRSGVQWYGRCPWHDSTSARGRSFSVNLAIGRYFDGASITLIALTPERPRVPGPKRLKSTFQPRARLRRTAPCHQLLAALEPGGVVEDLD